MSTEPKAEERTGCFKTSIYMLKKDFDIDYFEMQEKFDKAMDKALGITPNNN